MSHEIGASWEAQKRLLKVTRTHFSDRRDALEDVDGFEELFRRRRRHDLQVLFVAHATHYVPHGQAGRTLSRHVA